MATTPKKDPATGVLQDQPTPKAAERGDHDRIVMASRRADGSMDQVDPEFIGDKDVALAAAKEQLAVQATSAVDVAARGVTAERDEGGAESAEPDPDIKALKDVQEKAAEAAEARAEAEVNDRHQGLGD
ncbi:hypothetical protein [Streptomyces albidoflavus]|uniref:hypothetical protein n=1 Tax=Streptomyces albidoflavus TaxID=1886 RepID=UPI0033EC3300